MKVEFLDGPALTNRISRLAKRADSLDIAMAYVKIGGLRTLLKGIDSLIENKGQVRVLFGLSTRHCITDKESAKVLLKLSERDNVEVKKWNDPGFHPKLMIFYGNPTSIVVGSANLTIAAQSDNAEANILVKDPEPRLLSDVEQFFLYYYTPAHVLEQSDIRQYEKHYPTEIIPSSYRDLKEDNMPPPMQRKTELLKIKPNNIWKIAPGRDANQWRSWLKEVDEDGEGVVAIGWGMVGSLKNFKTFNELRDTVTKVAPRWNRTHDKKMNVWYVTNQLWQFKTSISKNDVFIVYSESRVLGIAKVEGDPKYWFNESGPLEFANQIKVNYKWYNQWPRKADKRIIKCLGKQGTLKLVEEPWVWDYLLKKLP